jgi:O-antigen ligase
VYDAAANSIPARVWRSGAMRHSLFYRIFFSRGMNRLMIILFALYLPVDYALRTWSPVAAISSAWDEVFLLFGFAYVVFRRMFSGRAEPSRATPFDVPLMFFIGIGFMLLCIVSPHMKIAIAGYRAVVQYMFWFFILTRIIENDGDILAFCRTFIAMSILLALHGIYQYIIAVPIPSHWVTQAEVGVRTRVFSIFGSPNIMGSFMVMAAPLTAAFAYRLKPIWARVLMWCFAFLMCFACLFTFSRGAWLGMAVAVFVFALYRDRRLLALLALAAGVAVFIPQVANRITFLFTSEFAKANMFGGRAGRLREGMNILYSVIPSFGYGLGRFGGAVAMQNQINSSLSYFYLDNYYLKTLIEMGYIGLAGFVFTVVAFIINAMRSVFRARGDSISIVAQGMFSGMLGVLVHCFTENIFEVPYMNAYFWGMAAIVIYIGFLRKPQA